MLRVSGIWKRQCAGGHVANMMYLSLPLSFTMVMMGVPVEGKKNETSSFCVTVAGFRRGM
jgi:hypothetical protein